MSQEARAVCGSKQLWVSAITHPQASAKMGLEIHSHKELNCPIAKSKPNQQQKKNKKDNPYEEL